LKRLLQIWGVLVLSVSTSAIAVPSQKIESKEIVFSILPFLSPVALVKRFTPLREYLEHNTGQVIVLESAPNFPEYLKRTINHEYDIVYTAPHFVPLSMEDGHYQLLAASHNLSAHIIVSESSRLKGLANLAGKRIAHGPKEAFLVVIGKHLLKEQGLVEENTPRYVAYKSHNAALRAVAGGDVDAAIVGKFHLKLATENKLRQIAVSAEFPGIAILASRDLPQSLRDKLAKSFVDIKDTEEGRQTLKKIRFPGFQSAKTQDFDALIPIALEALDQTTFKLRN